MVLKYLRARGLARTATLALVEPTEARFRATVIDPLVAGYVDAATNAEFKVAAGDQPSITAILLHMYLEARSQWDAWSAARAAALCPAAAPAAAAPSAQVLRRLWGPWCRPTTPSSSTASPGSSLPAAWRALMLSHLP